MAAPFGGCSSVGRALRSQRRSRRFESAHLHSLDDQGEVLVIAGFGRHRLAISGRQGRSIVVSNPRRRRTAPSIGEDRMRTMKRAAKAVMVCGVAAVTVFAGIAWAAPGDPN